MGFIRSFGLGISQRVQQGANLNYIAEYKALYNKLTIKPTIAIASAQNTFVMALVESGIWVKMSCLMPLNAGIPSPNDAVIWWNNPAKRGELILNPAYDPKKGFTGNGTSNYINTKWAASRDGGVIYTQNNCSAGFFQTNVRTASVVCGNGATTNNIGISLAPLLNNAAYLRAQSTYFTIPSDNANYFTAFSRNNASNSDIYRNKVKSSKTIASGALSDNEVYLLAFHNNGSIDSYSADTQGLFFAASYLTEVEYNLLIDAYSKMILSIASEVIDYTADGTVIDTEVFTVINNATANVNIYQDGAIVFDELGGSGGEITDNIVKSIDSFNFGELSFSALFAQAAGTTIQGLTSIGLYAGATSRIELYLDYQTATGNIIFRVLKENTEVYRVDTGISDFGQFKIKVSPYKDISLYVLNDDEYTQIGTTTNSQLGELFFFASANGYNKARTSIRDILIKGT